MADLAGTKGVNEKREHVESEQEIEHVLEKMQRMMKECKKIEKYQNSDYRSVVPSPVEVSNIRWRLPETYLERLLENCKVTGAYPRFSLLSPFFPFGI